MNADGNHRKRKVSEKEEPSTTSAEYSRGEGRTPPSHSVFFRITSDSSDEDTNEDNNFGSNRSPFSDNVKGKSSLSQWWSEVLKECKISYEEKPTPFENFMKEVKDGINMDVNPHCPDANDLISFCKDCIKENLKFSFDLKNVRDMRKDMMLVRQKKKKKIIAEIDKDIKKTEETAKHLDKANYFYSFWDRAMVELLEETKLLIHTVMNADPEEHKVVGIKRRTVGHCATVFVERDKSFFQSYCEMFGRIFFLKERYLPVETFLFRNKTVKSNPDVMYRFYPDPSLKEEGATSLLFITKVKDSTVKTNTKDAPLEEQVGLKVMGQVGSELIAASKTSVFWPNSLGIICMETKLIFVFLKQSQDHYRSIALDEPGPIDGEGKISYSQPFDMLNADDRQIMADLLFWLGCIQDYKNYKFI